MRRHMQQVDQSRKDDRIWIRVIFVLPPAIARLVVFSFLLGSLFLLYGYSN